MERATRARRAGRVREALKEAQRALTLRAGDVTAHKLAGQVAIALERWELAELHLRAVLLADGADCDAQFGLAKALDGQAQTEDARAGYGRYLEACPSDRRADEARAAMARLE